MVDYWPTYGFGYGAWAQLMMQWEQYGVFTVLLPLVLVFTIVFAILERINLFDNQRVHMLIALVVGFFTISNPSVSYFFMYLFGNLGWAIGILIGVVILLGLAIKPEEDTWRHIFIFVGAALLLAILARPTAAGTSGFQFILGDRLWYLIRANAPMVLIGIILIVCIIAIVGIGKGDKKKKPMAELYAK